MRIVSVFLANEDFERTFGEDKQRRSGLSLDGDPFHRAEFDQAGFGRQGFAFFVGQCLKKSQMVEAFGDLFVRFAVFFGE